MGFIPKDQLRPKESLNLTPMIDFVFLMLAFFASLTITQATLKDSSIHLVKVGPVAKDAKFEEADIEKIISICVTEEGRYKWLTEYHDIVLKNANQIGEELARQHESGSLPKDVSKTQVLLQIDKNAKWSHISEAIFAIREQGFEVHPVYQPDFANESAKATQEVSRTSPDK